MDALKSVVDVFAFGCTKYESRNWEKGLSWDETCGSLLRHYTDWYMGERYDKETKLPHLAHVAWNALALLAFELRGMAQFDDRPVTKERKK